MTPFPLCRRPVGRCARGLAAPAALLFHASAAVLFLAPPALAGSPTISSHAIDVIVEPAAGRMRATDTATLDRDGGGKLRFHLNDGLSIESATLDGRKLPEVREISSDGWSRLWEIDVAPGPSPAATLRLTYAGKLQDEVREGRSLSFTVGDDTRGVIGERGAYLSPGSAWYPVDGSLSRYDVSVHVPAPYLAVTQGTLEERTSKEGADVTRWRGKHTADGLYLVAGKWKRVEREANGLTVGAYLSEKNAAGGPRLLDATVQYLEQYGDLLGNYAYDRFDIVENWFTTGYGMPEFTLLGERVIARMLHEAERGGGIPAGYLDHEIVHCWWGNLVFADYAKGNWCEGLTTYCSNHMAKEWASADAAREHRSRAALRFSLRVKPERDYAVRQFRGKSEDADDDIGYGKCSMIFHMLRRDLGDEAFWETLRGVARTEAGRRLDWAGWQRAFEQESGRNLDAFFAQWLDRKGAPQLEVVDARVASRGGRMRVSGTLRQKLDAGEQPWRITVPVVVEHLEGREELIVDLPGPEATFALLVPSMPLRVRVDPDHHVFRRFADDELPACLAATLERTNKLVVYPDGDEALEAVAERVIRTKGGDAVPASKAPKILPVGRSVLILGDTARVPLLRAVKGMVPAAFPGADATQETSILCSVRNPVDAREFLTTFVGPPEVLAARSHALFYYQFDGRIRFEGRTPRSRSATRAKSHTTAVLLPPIARDTSPDRVREAVTQLTSEEFAGRRAGTPGDAATRKYLIEQLTLSGLDVREQAFAFDVRRIPTGATTLSRKGGPVGGALPFTASPETAGDLELPRLALDAGDDLHGAGLLVDLPAGSADPLEFVRQTAEMARARGALALIVRAPAPAAAADETDRPSVRPSDLWIYPGHLAPETAQRLAARAGENRSDEPLQFVADIVARTGSHEPLAIPTVMIPAGTELVTASAHVVSVRFDPVTIRTANVIGRIPAEGKHAQGTVVLGAHFDQLGAGFAGADDNASGVAALLEAAAALSANRALLGRDVECVFFGAQEWGLRGSRAYVAQLGVNGKVLAMVNADTVGARGVDDVHVVGVSMHPRLAKVVTAALEQSGLTTGRDIDRVAFPHGSDHWPFHEAGIPAVDLWSGSHRLTDTRDDLPATVDADKTARIGQTLAIAALALSGSF